MASWDLGTGKHHQLILPGQRSTQVQCLGHEPLCVYTVVDGGYSSMFVYTVCVTNIQY